MRIAHLSKLFVGAVIISALAVSACNTIAGAGRDVSAAGSAVTQGANEAKN